MYSYSPSTGLFYHSDVPATREDDAVELTDDQYLAVFAAQRTGLRITAGKDGKPVAVDPHLTMSLADAKVAKQTELSRACQATIIGGFTSNALGSPRTYPSDTINQSNILLAAQVSIAEGADWSTPLWCQDSRGIWAQVDHSSAQAQTVARDLHAWIRSNLQRNQLLRVKLASYNTQAGVANLTW